MEQDPILYDIKKQISKYEFTRWGSPLYFSRKERMEIRHIFAEFEALKCEHLKLKHDYVTLVENMEDLTEKNYYNRKMEILRHHYNFPTAWYETRYGSSLLGHPGKVEEKYILAMENIYPKYRKHLESIIATYASI